MLITPETPADHEAIEALYDRAFGADRQGRTAYRLRESVEPVAGLGFTIRFNDLLKGAIRFWPVRLDLIDGVEPALLLGPIAVEPSAHREGYGRALMRHGLSAARDLGHGLVILVGDPGYYGQFGFTNAHTAWLEMPGPVEKARLLAHRLDHLPSRDLVGLVCRPIDPPTPPDMLSQLELRRTDADTGMAQRV